MKFKCKECGKLFSYGSDCFEHAKNKHHAEPSVCVRVRWVCAQCGAKFDSKEACVAHAEAEHPTAVHTCWEQ